MKLEENGTATASASANASVLTEEEQAQAEAVCNAKTPVSLLQELYVRRGMTPKYDLVQIEGAVHEPTFKYRVTVGEFVATGCGQSKKKAKHSAAKAILDRLLGAQNAGIAAPGQPIIPENVQDVFSPYEDGIDGNPVGILQELCMSRRWPPPTYDLNEEEGLPHERSFIIVCIINKHRETGIGKSKKVAKRQAANKMIARLNLIPTETDESAQNIDEDDLAQGLVMRLSHQKESSRGNIQVHKFHKILQNVEGRGIQLLHNPDSTKSGEDEVVDETEIEEIKQEEDIETNEELLEDPVKFLDFISKEQKFEVTFVDVEEISKKGRYQCMVQLSLTPVAVCFGAGTTEEEAKKSCAENALDYLKGYANKERIYISNAISILGGIPQDMFAKKKKIDKGMLASTHLVCPEGPKYNAALNWGVPVVNKDWVRACLKEWKCISEKPFLIGNSTTFNKDKPLPLLPVEDQASLVEDADDKEATVEESADDKEATVDESADDKDATEEESAVQEDGDQKMDNSNWYWQYGTSVITRTAARFDQMPAGKLKIAIVLDQDIISMINDIKFDSVSKSVSYLEDQMDYDNNKAMTKSKDDMKKEKNEDEANQAEDNVEEDGRVGVSETEDTARDSTLKPALGKRSRSAEKPIPAVKKIKKNSVKNEERLKCKHCEKQIKKNYLKSHIRDVHKKVKVGCPCCDKQFSHSSLRYHIKQEHSNECTRCLECNKSVIATDLFKHMKKKHKINQVNKPGKKDYHSSTVKNQKEKWVITPLQKSINRLNKVKNGGKVLAPKGSNKLVPNKVPKIKEDIDKMLWERMAALHEEEGSHNLAQKSSTDQVDVNDKENIHAAVKAVNDSPNGTEDDRVRNQIHQEIVGVVNKSSNVLGDNNKVDLYGSKDPVMTEKSSDQPIIQDKKTKMLKYVQVFEERMAFKQSQCSLKCKEKICSGCEAKCRKICRSCKRMLVEKKAFTETSEIEWANNLLDCALDRFLGGLN